MLADTDRFDVVKKFIIVIVVLIINSFSSGLEEAL